MHFRVLKFKVGETRASWPRGMWLYLACSLRYGAGKNIWKLPVTRRLQFFSNPLSHPGSGSDQTIANERQGTALAMLYIGWLVTCGINYSFTPQTNFFFLHEKPQYKHAFGKEGKL